jgi:dihydrofolate reductase
MGGYVLGFREIDKTQVAIVGGKGAQLGELSRIEGIRVPAGFCVTTDAYQRIMAETPSIDAQLDQLSRVKPNEREATRALSAEIRQILDGIAVPDDLAAAIVAALARLSEQTAYAVRSSATAEDLPTASFAGQHDTYLNVMGSAAIDGELRVAGPDREVKRESSRLGATVVGFRFCPGAASVWLRTPASEITGARIPLEAFWGPEARSIAEWAGCARAADRSRPAALHRSLRQRTDAAPTLPRFVRGWRPDVRLVRESDSVAVWSKYLRLLHGYWPRVASSGSGTPAEVRLARILDEKPKHVVSRHEPRPGWNAARTEGGADDIRALKQRTGGTLLLVASPTLARALVQWGLVDEYHVAVSSLLARHGPTFLSGLERSVTTRLLGTTQLGSGVVIQRHGLG